MEGHDTLADRPNTALLIVDVQTGVVAKTHDRDANLGQHRRARRQGSPAPACPSSGCATKRELVPGQDAWQIAPELVPAEGEPIVEKRYGDALPRHTRGAPGDLRVGKLAGRRRHD